MNGFNAPLYPVDFVAACDMRSDGPVAGYCTASVKKRRRRSSRRLKMCSLRRIESGTKVDTIKPLDMNHVSQISVGEQFYKYQNLSKIINCTSKFSV